MLWRLAWRNLWRRKRRTAITLASVAFGVWLSVTFTGIGDHTYSTMINTSARMGFGHLTAHAAGWLESLGFEKRLSDAESIAERLRATDGVKSAHVRITGQAMFAAASDSAGGVFLAIEPEREDAAVNLFVRSIVEGALFDGSDPQGIVIGKVLAEKLGVGLGKRVVYTVVDVNGEIVSEVARVRGIFETGADDLDGSFALLPMDRVRKTLGYGEREASVVSVFIDDHRHADLFRDRLAPMLSQGETISTWEETQSALAGVIKVDRAMNYLFQALIAILIGAGVLNTILMSVLERKREFGMMMAIGTTPRQLFGVVSAEAFLVGLIGLIVGVVLSLPWYWFMSTTGIDMREIQGTEMNVAGVMMEPVMKLRLFPESIVAILIGVFGLTMLAGLYPAWQSGRDPPVETLKRA